MGNDRHSIHLSTNIWWQSSSTQQRKRPATRGLVDRGSWETTQREQSSRKVAPRWSRPTPRNSHVSLFPYRWQKYLVSHRWRMYHKWYSCGAYCWQPGEIIHLRPLCFFWFLWSSLGRFVKVSEIWSFKIAKLFWASWYPWDSYGLQWAFYKEKNILKKQNDLVSKTFGFYFSNIFLPY